MSHSIVRNTLDLLGKNKFDITDVSIVSVKLTLFDVVQLMDAVNNNDYIQHVLLQSCSIDNLGLREIIHYLDRNERIQTLNLRNNNFDDNSMDDIIEMLQKNTTLKRLYLANNSFSEDSLRKLYDHLQTNSNLLLCEIDNNIIVTTDNNSFYVRDDTRPIVVQIRKTMTDGEIEKRRAKL